jgi:DNA-binding NtrC family response regulator
MSKLLVIDSDIRWQRAVREVLAPGYEIVVLKAGQKPDALVAASHFAAILLDLSLDSHAPLDLLQHLTQILPDVPLIATGNQSDSTAIVQAVKLGAADFFPKHLPIEQIRLVLDQVLEECSLKNELAYLRREQDVIYDFDDVIARSGSMKRVIKALKKFASKDANLLVTGETGTGKSFLSGTVHFNSIRRKRPFIKINCANIPETLLESELFGHERGAFTGADKTRVGRFEQAHGGTIFLDEIGEMSLALQAKMLRVLEEKQFERVGGNKTISVDVRVIAATNRNLDQLTANGQFRTDLYYRLNVLTVALPPLRERLACIAPLAQYLLEKICRSLKKPPQGFQPAILKAFQSYNWPGNIRQLANTIERAAILEDGELIQAESIALVGAGALPLPECQETSSRVNFLGPGDRMPRTLEEIEKAAILQALEAKLWIQKDAAQQLGISPRALIYKIKKFGITHPRWRKHK